MSVVRGTRKNYARLEPIRTMKFHFDGWRRTLKFYLLYHKFCIGE